MAVGGKKAIEKFGLLADHLIAVEPNGDLVRNWHTVRRGNGVAGGGRVVGQIPICWIPTAMWPSSAPTISSAGSVAGGVSTPTSRRPRALPAPLQFVRPEDVADSIPCGPDLDAIVDKVRPYWEAGFTDVALVQVGGDEQEQFLKEAAEPLLEALRSAAPGRK